MSRSRFNPASQIYDYTSSGIDNFLSRSIDQVSWQTSLEATLNMPGSSTLSTLPGNMNSNNQRYDSTQVTGSLGDTIQIGGDNGGNVTITQNGITANDGNNDYLLIGSDGQSSGNSG